MADPNSLLGRRGGTYPAAVRRLLIVLALASSCTPRACDSSDERALAREVEFLVADDGPIAAEAEARLLGRGRSAIAVLETGLYAAEPAGRRRVVRVLTRLGEPEAIPILEHLAARDPAAEVREAAAEGLERLRQPIPRR